VGVVAEVRVFLAASILFTAAYSAHRCIQPDGLSALLIGLGGVAGPHSTGDVEDFGRWMDRRARLPLRVMTPRQFLTEVHP
jgi:hypothetical protein